MREEIAIGLLYSVTGTYGMIGRDVLDGAMLALAENAAKDACPVRFRPVLRNPGGNIEAYLSMGADLMARDGCRHVLGTITSIARKEIIPLVEKHDALLWYVLPYEGFEACENVIYTGAAPNQHIVPLFEHMLAQYGSAVCLTGSNYVWGWEVNRIARELVNAVGGQVLGERYLPFDDTDTARLIDEIERKRPDFVLNNLVGTSSYAFVRAYHALGQRNPDFAPEVRPVVSCNLTECELPAIGAEAARGHLCSAIFFENADSDESRAFRRKVTRAYGAERRLSAYLVAGYEAVRMLERTIVQTGSSEIDIVRRALYAQEFSTAAGPLRISAETNHASLTPHLGRINGHLSIDIIEKAAAPIPADPWLVNFDTSEFARNVHRRRGGGRQLRAVR